MLLKTWIHILWMPGDWRYGVDPKLVGEKWSKDSLHEIKAALAVHTETDTGVTSCIAEIRKAMDKVKHPVLFSLGAVLDNQPISCLTHCFN